MKNTLEFIAILLATFTVAILTSALFSIDWMTAHWSRSFLVVLLMAIELCIGFLMAFNYIKSNILPKKNDQAD